VTKISMPVGKIRHGYEAGS